MKLLTKRSRITLSYYKIKIPDLNILEAIIDDQITSEDSLIFTYKHYIFWAKSKIHRKYNFI